MAFALLARRSAGISTTTTARRFISVGARVPSVKVKEVVGDAVNEITTDDLFKGKKVVLVGMPAAFSPTCSDKHLPGYLAALPQFKAKGVSKVAVVAVNDFFAMKAWGKAQKLGEAISLVADGNGELTKALELELDLKKAVLGVRCKRFSAVVDNGVVKALNVEPDGTGYTTSAAEATLKQV